jgi:3-carboxy-cis,cis-muconate cycloisomerase
MSSRAVPPRCAGPGPVGNLPACHRAEAAAAARFENLDPAALAASARTVGYPVVGLVRELSRAAGEAGRWTHWGATTQDIMDTAARWRRLPRLALSAAVTRVLGR